MGRRKVVMTERRGCRERGRRLIARAVEWNLERVGSQRSGRVSCELMPTPRMEVEGVMEDGGHEGGREGGEGGGQMEGVMEDLEGWSSPPKESVKALVTSEKGRRAEGEEERMERSSTKAPTARTTGRRVRGRMKKSKTNKKR